MLLGIVVLAMLLALLLVLLAFIFLAFCVGLDALNYWAIDNFDRVLPHGGELDRYLDKALDNLF